MKHGDPLQSISEYLVNYNSLTSFQRSLILYMAKGVEDMQGVKDEKCMEIAEKARLLIRELVKRAQ